MTETGTQDRRAPRFGSGWSDDTNPTIAGREAVEAAIDGRSLTSADLIVLFADVALDAVPLLDAAMAAAGPARVVAAAGTTTFAPVAGLASCAAIHLPAGDVRFGVGWADVDGSLEAATRIAVGRARDEAAHLGDHGVVLLLSDVSNGDQRDVVRGAYDIAGATVPLVGGAVGCEHLPEGCWLAADGMVLTRGVVAVWLASASPLGVAFDHGWRAVGRPMQVTRASGDRILELDGCPADVAYRRARETVDPELLELGIPGMELPIGVPGDDGRYEVRAFVVADGDDIRLEGVVHEQAIVRLMGARPHDLVEGAAAAVAAAADQLGREPRGALVFSCNIRADLLQRDVVREIDAIAGALGDAPAAGFFTYGEFAKVPGSQGFHSASVAVLAL